MDSFIVKDFSLKHTIECGQFFLYDLYDDFYEIINGKNVFRVKQEGNILFYEGITQEELIYFFSLDEDLNEITNDFEDEYLLLALEKYWGLRLIRQDLWQCIIGFVCSSASNIPKIKKNLRLICDLFGDVGFPEPGKLDNLEKLKEAKTGYRAKFIYEINEYIIRNPDFLNNLREVDFLQAKKMLMNLSGVGSKVATCVCLFGLGHNQAFPVDTWIKQIVEKLYLKKKAKNIREIELFIEMKFGKLEKIGLKQQYLFHYFRNNDF